jgi:hypothetical protein
MSSISATNPVSSYAYVQSPQSTLATSKPVTPPAVQAPAVGSDSDGDNDGSSGSKGSNVNTYA